MPLSGSVDSILSPKYKSLFDLFTSDVYRTGAALCCCVTAQEISLLCGKNLGNYLISSIGVIVNNPHFIFNVCIMLGLNSKSLVNNRYRVIKKLGEGGKGIVLECLDQSLDRPVAVKLMKSTPDEETNARFQREARITARLIHPNIVAVFDVGIQDGHPFLVMEYVEGRSLAELVNELKTLPPQEIIRISKEVAGALNYAHTAGVLHRDIKPENIMISRNGASKLMDFGLARSIDSLKLTNDRTIIGTPEYISPEIALGKKIDERSDLYSLGCVMYYMAVGHPPFISEESVKLIYSHLNDQPRSIRQFRADFPADLDAVILSLLSKNPEERPRDSSALLKILENMGDGSRENGLEGPEGKPGNSSLTGLSGIFRNNHILPLVGRDTQVQSMKEQIDSALSGSGSMSILTGERGTGRSRLLKESMIYASMRSMTVIGLRCNETKRSVPGQTITDLFREYLSSHPDQSIQKLCENYKDVLPRILPELAPGIMSSGGIPALSVEEQTGRYYEAIIAFLKGISQENPLLISIDDLHLVDRISMTFMTYLNDYISSMRMCLIASSDPIVEGSSLIRLISKTLGSHTVRMMEIGSLNKEQTYVMVRGLLSGDKDNISDTLSEVVYDKTHGNPLFVEETIRYLLEGKKIYMNEEGLWEVRSPSDFRFPATIRTLIKEKITHLDEDQGHLLRMASVLGVEFDLGVLKDMVEMKEDEFARVIDYLVREGFLMEEGTESGHPRLTFADSRTKDMLYDEISIVKRTGYNKRAASIIESRTKGINLDKVALTNLARYYLRGGNVLKALKYNLMRANLCAGSYDFTGVSESYAICLNLVQELKDSLPHASMLPLEGYLHLKLSESLGNYAVDQAIDHAERAITIFQKTGNDRGIIEASTSLVGISESPDYYYNLVKTIPDTEENMVPKIGFYIAYAAVLDLYFGRTERTISVLEESLDLARKYNSSEMTLNSEYWLCYFSPISSEEDKTHIVNMLNEMRVRVEVEMEGKQTLLPETPRSEFISEMLANYYYFVELDIAKCDLEFERGISSSKRHMCSLYARTMEAERNYMVTIHTKGSKAAAEFSSCNIEMEREILHLSSTVHTKAFHQATLAWNSFVGGEKSEALSYINAIRKLGGDQYRILYHPPLVMMLTEDEEFEEASREIHDALEFVRTRPLRMDNVLYNVFMSMFAAEVGLALGNRKMYEDGLARIRFAENVVNEQWITACRLRAEALNDLGSGGIDNSIRFLKKASTIWDKIGMPFWQARDLMALSSAYTSAGEHAKAVVTIDRAIELFTRHKASYFAEKALAGKALLKA